ncbi:MAG: choice-of-anchor J domain-containing protein [Salinivirgaceae bacterium]|nr:choice-of-anchor J domain-containing protein [Salinivirgaceae bacterium]
MRKITLLLFLTAFVLNSFSQKTAVKVDQKFIFEQPSFKGEGDITDTLIPTSFFTGTPTVYTATSGGYAYGTNCYGNSAVAQQYNEGALTVQGVQLWIAANTIGEGNLTFKVWELTDGVPSTEITSMDVPFAQVTPTNGEEGPFLYSMIFDTPAEVSGEFVVGVTFDETLTDGFSLVGTTDGDAEVSDMSWFNIDGWYTFADDEDGWNIDADVAVWPMVTIEENPAIVYFSEDFETVTADEDIALTDWTNAAEVGTRKWIGKTYNENSYAQISSFGSAEANVAWLITPAIDLTKTWGEMLSFDINVGYFTHDGFEVFVSTDFSGDVTTATWIDVTSNFTIPQTTSYSGFATAGTMDISAYTDGIVYVAFKYTGDATADETTTYQVDNVVVKVDGVGIFDKQAVQSLDIYPNPVNNELNITDLTGASKVMISNLIGQVVIATDATSSRINTEILEPGVYVVTVVSENGTKSARIIKE